MQDLRVVGVEERAIVVASGDGTRFRLAVDDTLQSSLRQASPRRDRSDSRLAPREIQAHIRSGMSAEDVAQVTGAELDYIRRFEGPVLAEREYIVESALNVLVHTALESEGAGGGSTFGSVIRERLVDLSASDERWVSWKEAGSGWIVKLAFTADQIDHDARWSFEPKRSALSPMNSEAITLSQQGEITGGLIPRLRAVGNDERPMDASRFDSGAFDVASGPGTTPHLESIPFTRATSSPEVSAAAINRAPEREVASSQTADLLEALRRRRGEREAAASGDEETRLPALGRVVELPLDPFDDLASDEPPAHAPAARDRGRQETPHARTAPQPFSSSSRGTGSKKGRAAMPSWDEIVFGARSDDD